MVKANIRTESGISINLDGSIDEIMELIKKLEKKELVKKEKIEVKKKNRFSIGDMIIELREEGFFKNPRSLVEIKKALQERGNIYTINTLSTQVIRQVRKRNLGRIKEENKWKYVRR